MSVINFDNKELDPRNIKGWFIDAFVIYKSGVFTHTFYMLCGIALSYLAFTLFHQYLSVDISIIEILAPFFSPFAFFYFYSNICKKDTGEYVLGIVDTSLSICAEDPALLVRGWIARRAKHDWVS